MKGEKKAYITLYLTLVLGVLLSLVFVLLEGIRNKTMRTEVESVMDVGLYSVFGEYHRQLLEQYDLFFIDAAKSQYFRYLNHFYPMSYVGSYFIFDNINFHGIVEEPSLSHNRSTLQMTRKLKRFKERILKDERFKATFYSEIGDGILVLERIK